MDESGLVNGRIIEHQMDFECGRNMLVDGVKELPEFNAAVPGAARADHHSSLHVQRGKKIGGAVPDIIVCLALDLSRAHRQDRSGRLSRLDLGLFVHAEDERPLGWIEVESHDITHLFHEERIVRELEGFGPMRLKSKILPNTRDSTLAHTNSASQRAAAPVCRIGRC